MSSSIKKPFFFQPPWNIFFELHKLHKIRPWEVDISFLLGSFWEEMEKRGEVDFRASGVALDSSATIYLMKSKLLLKLEEPLPLPKPPPDFVPPPLSLPFRYEMASTTIKNLVKALDDVLKAESVFALKPRLEPILPSMLELLPPVDAYLMEIEEEMEKFYGFILTLAKKGGVVIFSKIIDGLKRIEVIKKFIILLFLAQRGDVNLWQEENFGKIYVTLPPKQSC